MKKLSTKQLLILSAFALSSSFGIAQDLISGGTNSWIMHTPDDGRTTMFLAPGTNGANFNFTKATQFLNTGEIQISSNFILGGTNSWMLHTPDDGRRALIIAPGANNTGWDFSKAISLNETGYVNSKSIVCSDWLRSTGITGWYNDTYSVGIFANDNFWIRAGNGSGATNAGFAAAKLYSYSDTFVGGKLTINSEISAPTGRFHLSGGEYLYILNKSGVVVGKEWGGSGNLTVQGTVAIGEHLSVRGTVLASKVKVAVPDGVNWTWADYVFEDDYKLKPLKDVETYINCNKHLEGVPTTEEVKKDGVDVASVTAKMLEKIEELTLYVIELNKKMEVLEKENETLKNNK